MTAQRNDITPRQRVQLSATMIAQPEENRSQLAQTYNLSRPTLYSILHTGERALQERFNPPQPPQSPGTEGFWLWVDANAIKRLIVLLRAACGATFIMIAQVIVEVFGVQISEETIRQVVEESYQRAYEYRSNVDLSRVERATVDEMYRWGRCIFTGVDADSLYIFLCEKQYAPTTRVWQEVMGRLKDNQQLHPSQCASDGLGALENGAEAVWPEARVVHDINHQRRALEKVRSQFERLAYQAIAKTEKMQKRYEKGPTRRTSREALATLLLKAKAAETKAIDKSEEVSSWVQQAHDALKIINPTTEKINDPCESQRQLQAVAKRLKELGGFYVYEARRYLDGTGQKLVEERREYLRVMERLASEHQVPFAAVEKAAYLWELNKQYQAATWSGTKEQLKQTIQRVRKELQQQVREKASSLLETLCYEFRSVLSASSAVEWSHQQIGAVLPAQKRVSSGWLGLRVSYLNLTAFKEGVRQGQSPHALLTGEEVEDWLVKLGYAPRNQEIRSYKKLGWKRLVEPFQSTWRENWVEPKKTEEPVVLEEKPEVEDALKEAA